MKKSLAIIISLLFFLVLIVGTSQKNMSAFKNFRERFSFLQSQKYLYGDLYGISFLPPFKISANKDYPKIPLVSCKTERKMNLYSLCDSYLYTYIKSDVIFSGVKSYEYSRWGLDPNPANFQLDTSLMNVLLIERVERHIIDDLTDTNTTCDKLNFDLQKNVEKEKATFKANMGGFIEHMIGSINAKWQYAIHLAFNPFIERNLEFCLFDYAFFNPIKELKASINYDVFDRIDKDVVLSEDKKYLFTKETTGIGVTSSFGSVSDKQVDKIVSSMNYIEAKALKIGFDKVYFSFMPNPASIMGYRNKTYNNLIPRIQNHPKLKAKTIDIYTPFNNTDLQVYQNSDTHWNGNGLNTWINLFNNHLDSLSVSSN